MTPSPHTILFAGGGTGGHIFPSLAIAERLTEKNAPLHAHFLVSQRPLDAQLLAKTPHTYSPLPARPLSKQPWDWPGIYAAYRKSSAQVRQMIADMNASAVVAMGGFVSAPAIESARKAKIPVAMVNLDAVPGRSNRLMARKATQIFSVYPHAGWPGAEVIGLPLRRSAVGPDDPHEARRSLGLDPQRETLFVTGASQGAQSINRLMIELVSLAQVRKELRGWQVLHLAGSTQVDELRDAYARAEIPAKVEAFCDTMGNAWRSATLAISRSGAGSVAEVWANAVPTIFLPYPYHKDQHQRLNALPLVEAGGAQLFADLIDAPANAQQLIGPLLALMRNAPQRGKMVDLMRHRRPVDGADALADWLIAR
jgi:UDP-N-acetylglucosamine--N-acetylmuramyl-(pentapeptide) pyrophosphoryl-undecaprenol N-acetylglucosamine transferase